MSTPDSPPLTTHEVSQYLNVDLTTVILWCNQGKLAAYKTPGGHRRVETQNLLEFLRLYRMPVPSRLAQKVKKNLKVLVVDDEASIRRVMSRGIKKAMPEIELFEAQDGFEAGKLVLDSLPDLVILDLKLPGMDGFRVCANIRQDSRFKETKILAVTGENTAENRKKILAAGADDYLPKPFEVKTLLEKAFKLLNAPAETLK